MRLRRFSLLASLALLMPFSLHAGFGVAEDGGGGGANPNQNNTDPNNPLPAAGSSPAIDVQAEIQKAVQAEREAFKAATGFATLEEFNAAKLKEQGKFQELATAESEKAQNYKQLAINGALQAACAGSIAPDLVAGHFKGQADIDANGVVTIGGKPAAEAIAAYLKANPHLAKPTGNNGSQSPHNTTGINQPDLSKMTPAQKMEYGRQQKAGN